MNTKTEILRPSPVSPRKAPVVRTGNSLRFDNTCGARHGSFDSPISGGLEIDPAGAEEFGLVAVVWSGSSNPIITGHDQINVSGSIDSPGTHTVYLHWIDGQVNVSFFTPDLSDQLPPSTLALLQIQPSPAGSNPAVDSEPPSALAMLLTAPTGNPPAITDTEVPSALAMLSTVPTNNPPAPDTDTPSALALLQTAP